jgi:hypothetical protein
VLLVLIPTAWLAVALFALTMCRLAARSDASDDGALADLLATSPFDEHEALSMDGAAEPLPPERERRGCRATG